MNPELIERARELGRRENGLAVVVTTRPDGSAQASVVNAGILAHPVTGVSVVGFAARGYAKKLTYLRARPRATVVFRSGWDWVAVEGPTELHGPDDPPGHEGSIQVLPLLRDVCAAAVGGTGEDWRSLDDTFRAERHTCVLVHPDRVYSNPIEL